MIRMIQSTSATHAKSYFSDALSKSDYYTNDQELPGVLRGRLAERLGLTEEVSKEVFFKLCENINPLTGEMITPRTSSNRTVGYDINFHAPKSVSILHSLSKDNHIADAFKLSVNDTMKAIEADCQTRVRKGSAAENRATHELIWAEFLHQTARPVDNAPPDMHLHIHAYVFNMTWDQVEQQTKAAQFREIKTNMPYFEALFQKNLSDRLIKQGYRIRKTGKSFEVEGVPRKVIDLFSKRTNAIGQVAKEKGIYDPKKLDTLGAHTRAKKQKGLSMSDLQALWKRQIKGLGNWDLEEDNAVRHGKWYLQPRITEHDCVEFANKHSFERASVVGERRLLESALRHGIGDDRTPSAKIIEAVELDKRFIKVKDKGRYCLTTKEVLSEEREMVALAKEGKGQIVPLYNTIPKMELRDQQANAVGHILTTSHRVSIIMGAAGTGKTTILQTAERLINRVGKKVIVVAPTAEASKGVLVADGFKNANTVAKLLSDHEMQKELKGQVLWVDESGLLGTKDMKALLKLAKASQSQLVLAGDTRQHASVVRGDALRILNTVAGIKAAEVNKIFRQKTQDYRTAVEDLSKGKVASAFERLDKIGAIKEIDPLNPNTELVNDYVSLIKKGKSALIVSPTHKQGDSVTEAIRARMKTEGLLSQKEISVLRYSNLNWTEAQKGDWRNFSEGLIIQFNQNSKEAPNSSLWKVSNVNDTNVNLKNDKGVEINLLQAKARNYDVLEMSCINIAKGDKIKITRNQKQSRLNNGMTMDVISIDKKGQIKLKHPNSRKTYNLDKGFGHLTHAHCITSYAAQGKTVDHVLISQPSSTFTATDARQFYVSVSRGKESVKIYTDDKSALLEYSSQIGDRQSAIELVKKDQSHLDLMMDQFRKDYTAAVPIRDKQLQFALNKQFDRDYEP